jgi:hypothetical protein
MKDNNRRGLKDALIVDPFNGVTIGIYIKRQINIFFNTSLKK